MEVIYWSDYACPYCYIGITRLRKVIASLELEGEIGMKMKALELDPDAPYEITSTTVDRFMAKYDLSKQAAIERVGAISRMGRSEGIDFRYSTALNTNMFDAHRMTKLAHALGNTRFEELCYEAYFVRNEVMADADVLRRLAVEAGLPKRRVERVLSSDEFADDVRADEREAHDMGVYAMPFFVIDGKYTIPGCRPAGEMARVLKKAHNATAGRSAAADVSVA